MNSVTVWTKRLGNGFAAIDCEECGPLEITDEPGPFVYDHLAIVHRCNMDTVEIHDPEEK